MSVPIEKEILAYIEVGKIHRIAGIIEKHKEAANIAWGAMDEFGQPLALRIIETGDMDAISIVLKNISNEAFVNLRYEVRNFSR